MFWFNIRALRYEQHEASDRERRFWTWCLEFGDGRKLRGLLLKAMD
jgi:hypothetical protein